MSGNDDIKSSIPEKEVAVGPFSDGGFSLNSKQKSVSDYLSNFDPKSSSYVVAGTNAYVNLEKGGTIAITNPDGQTFLLNWKDDRLGSTDIPSGAKLLLDKDGNIAQVILQKDQKLEFKYKRTVFDSEVNITTDDLSTMLNDDVDLSSAMKKNGNETGFNTLKNIAMATGAVTASFSIGTGWDFVQRTVVGNKSPLSLIDNGKKIYRDIKDGNYIDGAEQTGTEYTSYVLYKQFGNTQAGKFVNNIRSSVVDKSLEVTGKVGDWAGRNTVGRIIGQENYAGLKDGVKTSYEAVKDIKANVGQTIKTNVFDPLKQKFNIFKGGASEANVSATGSKAVAQVTEEAVQTAAKTTTSLTEMGTATEAAAETLNVAKNVGGAALKGILGKSVVGLGVAFTAFDAYKSYSDAKSPEEKSHELKKGIAGVTVEGGLAIAALATGPVGIAAYGIYAGASLLLKWTTGKSATEWVGEGFASIFDKKKPAVAQKQEIPQQTIVAKPAVNQSQAKVNYLGNTDLTAAGKKAKVENTKFTYSQYIEEMQVDMNKKMHLHIDTDGKFGAATAYAMIKSGMADDVLKIMGASQAQLAEIEKEAKAGNQEYFIKQNKDKDFAKNSYEGTLAANTHLDNYKPSKTPGVKDNKQIIYT